MGQENIGKVGPLSQAGYSTWSNPRRDEVEEEQRWSRLQSYREGPRVRECRECKVKWRQLVSFPLCPFKINFQISIQSNGSYHGLILRVKAKSIYRRLRYKIAGRLWHRCICVNALDEESWTPG